MNSPNSSYKQIIKSTSIFGSSQLINVVLGIIRSKLTAVFLGTIGVGIFGLLQSVIDLNRSFSGLGLDSGATKNIAAVEILGDEKELGKTLFTINIWYLISGIFGALVCIVFARPLSFWTFGDGEYTLHIILLSIAVFFVALSAGLTASLQGLRKIPYMALASSITSLVTLLVMIPIYYCWRIDGIVPMLILANVITFFITFFFYRKVKLKLVKIPIKEAFERGRGMLRLGVFIVVAGVISTLSVFLVRAFINREGGLEDVGLFQASWVITTLFWGVILRSTNTDFFPKLCSIIDDKQAAKAFVNEQTHIVLLIISPIIIGLIIFSEYVLHLLYTSDFTIATNTLRWHLVGAFIKIASTPVATVMLAKNRGGVHLFCESVFWGVYFIACYLLYPFFKIEATGMAYFIAYVVYMPVVYFASASFLGYMWNTNIIKTLSITIILALIYIFYKPSDFILVFGLIVFFISVIYSLFKLKDIVDLGAIIRWFINRLQ